VGLVYRDSIVLGNGRDVFSCSIAAHDDTDGDAGGCDDRLTERKSRIHDDDLRLAGLSTDEREQPGRETVLVVLDTGEGQS
jgi:hypothetical protein